LVIASQKGGSGKTTLTGHLAVEAERAGHGPVALIDTDPQGSLAEWWNARAAQTPYFVKVGPLELEDTLKELRQAGISLAIIDTPPAITGAIARVVSFADLVLIPTRPSPHDLRAVGATVDIADQHKKPVVFVVNDATARARITGEAAIALSQHGTVAPVTLFHRIDYVASMVDGRTAGEAAPQSKSSEEVSMLWQYIADRLERLAAVVDPAPDPSLDPLAELLNEVEIIRPRFGAMRPMLVLDDAAADFETPPDPQEDVFAIEPPPEAPAIFGAKPQSEEDDYKGAERRSGPERREPRGGYATFGGPERRSTNPFGRRRSDRNA
jgi:chromosome partitioning protein